MSDDKDARIAELEEKLAAECNTALKSTIHDQRRELKRLNERIAELERERDALAAALAPVSSALEMLYEQWENGTDSYEDAEELSGYLGKAFDLSDEQENAVLRALTSVGIETALGKSPLDPQAILAARLAEERKSLEEKIAQMESFTRGNIGIHWAEENDRLREQRDALAAALGALQEWRDSRAQFIDEWLSEKASGTFSRLPDSSQARIAAEKNVMVILHETFGKIDARAILAARLAAERKAVLERVMACKPEWSEVDRSVLGPAAISVANNVLGVWQRAIEREFERGEGKP